MIYEAVFRALNDRDVDYLVAGGLAVNLHGAPRATQDLDLLLAMTDENIQSAIQGLLDFGYEPRLPVDPMDFSDPKIRRTWRESKDMNAFTFQHSEHRLRTVDFLFDLPLSYQDCRPSAVMMQAEDLSIPVVSIDDLISLKKGTSRELDQLDVNMLEQLKELDNEESES